MRTYRKIHTLEGLKAILVGRRGMEKPKYSVSSAGKESGSCTFLHIKVTHVELKYLFTLLI